MPKYSCTAIDKKGNRLTDIMDVASEAAATEMLHNRGLIIVSIKEKGGAAGKGMGLKAKLAALNNSKAFQNTKINLQDLLMFTSQLAVMIDGGLHLMDCLMSLGKEASNKTLAKLINKVRDDVRDGATLYDAMKRHPYCFYDLYLGLIKAGESSGELPLVLNQLADYLEKSDKLSRKVKSATMYPKIMLAISFLCLLALFKFAIPQFKKIFDKAKMTLPLPTRILLNLSDLVNNYLLHAVIITGVISVLIYIFLKKTDKWRYWWDYFKLKAPVFGLLNNKSAMSRFTRTMGVMLKSGVSVIDAIEMSGEVAGNLVIKKACEDIKLKVEHGSSISNAMAAHPVFPELVRQMTASGEQVGSLDKMLIKSSEFYDQQVESILNKMTTLLEPMFIAVIAVIFSVIILGVLLPMIYMGKAVGKG